MKKKIDIGLFFFFFVILFAPKIGIIDLKLICILVYGCISLSRNRRLKLSRVFLITTFTIVLLIALFLINFVIYTNVNIQILLRYIRCMISLIVIFNYIINKTASDEQFINALSVVLMLHAVSIIAEVVFPAVRPYIYIVSRYAKKELPLRATGLLSGYDFAGYLLIIGLIARIILNAKKKKKLFDLPNIIYVIAILFTSRVNTILLMALIIGTTFYMAKTQHISSTMTLIIVFPIVLAGSVFTILTIDAFAPIRFELMQRFSWIGRLSRTINNTYAEGSFTKSLFYHFEVNDDIHTLFGNGVFANRDPGYINSIYECGYFGMIIKIMMYIYWFFYSYINRKRSIIFMILPWIIVLTLIMEVKLIFLFATGSFELILSFLAKGLWGMNHESNLFLVSDRVGDKP